MHTPTFKLALIQMLVEGGQSDLNLRRAEKLIGEAAARGADLALLPEALDLGWTHPSSKTEAQPIPDGEPCRRLAQAAARHHVFVCAGLTERHESGVFNSAVIIDRGGKVLCTHRKLNELDIGHEYYGQGDRLKVVHTELGALGLMICADGFAQDHVLSRALCYMGADVILSPSAWAVMPDHDNASEPYSWKGVYDDVARDFGVWIAGVSNVGPMTAGPWTGRVCIGCSLVVGPRGEVVQQGPYGADAETILYVDITPVKRPTRGCGWEAHWKQQEAAGKDLTTHGWGSPRGHTCMP